MIQQELNLYFIDRTKGRIYNLGNFDYHNDDYNNNLSANHFSVNYL